MKNIAIIGSQFGDEGKGLITDYFCSRAEHPIVVRFSGGQQAGHTVVRNGVRHVFSNFGSGTLLGAPTYWSKNCTADPVGILNELDTLLGYGGISPILMVDEECPITTPYDKVHNQNTAKYGTCGVGVGSTIDREEKNLRLHAGDLLFPSVLKHKLEMIRRHYACAVSIPSPIKVEEFMHACSRMAGSASIIIVRGMPDHGYDTVVYEGSQGLMLDPDIGFFPHVTRTHTGTLAIPASLDHAIVVTRAYQTRHGAGPMSDYVPNNIMIDADETNVNNRWQGEFRRTLLDLDMLGYALRKDAHIRDTEEKTLAITCLDHVTNEHRYIYNGSVENCADEKEFVLRIAGILGFKSIITSSGPSAETIKRFVTV